MINEIKLNTPYFISSTRLFFASGSAAIFTPWENHR